MLFLLPTRGMLQPLISPTAYVCTNRFYGHLAVDTSSKHNSDILGELDAFAYLHIQLEKKKQPYHHVESCSIFTHLSVPHSS